jgi:hypothetical protein
VGVATLSLTHSRPAENCHLCTKNKKNYTILHTIVLGFKTLKKSLMTKLLHQFMEERKNTAPPNSKMVLLKNIYVCLLSKYIQKQYFMNTNHP